MEKCASSNCLELGAYVSSEEKAGMGQWGGVGGEGLTSTDDFLIKVGEEGYTHGKQNES